LERDRIKNSVDNQNPHGSQSNQTDHELIGFMNLNFSSLFWVNLSYFKLQSTESADSLNSTFGTNKSNNVDDPNTTNIFVSNLSTQVNYLSFLNRI
jgi:hypothetical protein